nr:apolipoprotein N-acyltransferase [Rhodovulum sp. 12E13]
MSATGSDTGGRRAARIDPAPVLRLVGARWRGLGLAFLLGAVAALGQVPVSWSWLALGACALAIGLFTLPLGWRLAAWRGWAFGTGHFAVALFWIVEPFFVDPLRHGWLAPFALVAMAGGLALFWAAAFGLAQALGRGRAGRALWLVVALTGAEMLRSVVFTGFPWALIGHIWIGTPQMQLAALGGADALTLLTLAAAALPTLMGTRRLLLGAIAGAALAALPGAYAAWRMPDAPLPPAEPAVTVRLIQPNAPQHLKWRPDMIGVFWERSLDLTAAPAEGPAPDLVLWPETSVPYLLESAAPGFARMDEAAGAAWIAAGIQRQDEGGHWRNSLVALAPGGAAVDVYDKHHLVPFGEYMPLGDVFERWGIFGLAANLTGSYRPGQGARLMDLGPAGRAMPLICYEAIFSREIRALPERPAWLLHATNDAWFGQLSGPYQHLGQARLRAVEFGLPVLRAANTGVSAAIDAHGRVLAAIPLGRAGHLDVALPRALPPTPFARLGSLPVLAALTVLACIAAGLSLRKALARGRGQG